jgi:hypothetical protein
MDMPYPSEQKNDSSTKRESDRFQRLCSAPISDTLSSLDWDWCNCPLRDYRKSFDRVCGFCFRNRGGAVLCNQLASDFSSGLAGSCEGRA